MGQCYFLFVRKLNFLFLRKRFQCIEEIKGNVTRELKVIFSLSYQGCMENWIERLHTCVASNVSCFEGSKMNFARIQHNFTKLPINETYWSYVHLFEIYWFIPVFIHMSVHIVSFLISEMNFRMKIWKYSREV